MCESSTIPQKDQGRKKSAKKSVEINFISGAEPNSVNYETVNNQFKQTDEILRNLMVDNITRDSPVNNENDNSFKLKIENKNLEKKKTEQDLQQEKKVKYLRYM